MKEPVRILQVLGRLDRGGAETMIMNLYRCMDRSRIQFDFVIHTLDKCDYTEEIEGLGGKIYSMKPFGVSTAGIYCRQWREFFKKHKEYRIIHGHMRSTAALYLKEAKRAGLITIAHSHNTSSGSGISAVIKNLLQYPLRFQADYLFACSQLAGEWLYGKKACRSRRFHLLLNGILPEEFTFDADMRRLKREEMQTEPEIPVFLHVGRMEEQKNHRFLLQVMKELVKKEPSAQLWLCGTGPLMPEICAQLEKEEITAHVRLLGIREDVSALMQAADVFLFPSLYEGLPVTVVEAQAAGLPVVMSDTITEEVLLTELVKVCPLTAKEEVWAEKALELLYVGSCAERRSYAAQIAKKGYDVRKNAEELSAFYQKLYEEKP